MPDGKKKFRFLLIQALALALAKTMVGPGVDASGPAFPSDHPRKWRRKKVP